MATIHKRTLGSGQVVWELSHGTGRDRKRFVAGRSREEAQETLKQFERQLALHGQAPTDGSIESAVGQFKTYLATNRRPSTARRYGRVLTTFSDCFLKIHHSDVVLLRAIKPAHIEEYKLRRMEGSLREAADEAARGRELALRTELATGVRSAARKDNARFGWLGRKRFRSSVTPRTINYELRVIATFLRWTVRRNLLFVNPTVSVERLRVPKRALPKFLTADQLKRLFAACTEAERRLFATILLTGMRRGEIEHLTWTDINFELGVIFIQEKPQWNWKPKSDERVIPISPSLQSILKAQAEERRDDGLVFPNRDGQVDTHILEKLKKVARKAGVHATVHSLRHSFGAHLRMAGVSLADIADLLGHKDLATTQIYAKVHQQHLRSAVGKLAPIAAEVIDAPQGEADGGSTKPDPAVRLLKS
jgi:integrase